MSIQSMRNSSEGIVAKFIIGLIIIVFALFGMGSITTFLAPVPTVATVNGMDITQQEMEIEIERSRRVLLAQNRDSASIDEDQLRQEVLKTLIDRKLLLQAVDELGLAFGSAGLDAEIVATPVFQVDGVYDPDRFQLVIGSAGYNPINYRSEMRRDKMFRQLNSGIRESAFLTANEVERASSLAQQTRDIAFLRVDVEALGEDIEVTPEEVVRYYDAHGAQFETDETIIISYLEMKRDDFLAEVDVTEEALQVLFEETKDIYSEPERRQIAHILIEVNDEVSEDEARQKVDEIYDKIIGGENFTNLAKEHSDDPGSAELGGDLGFNDSGTFVPEFEEAAYQLSLNQMSVPIKTEFGFHLLKLLGIQEAKRPGFEEVRQKIEAQLRELGAEEIFVSRSALLSKIAYEAPDLIEPSEELNLEIKTTGNVSRNETSGIASNPGVIEAAFSADVLLEGYNSNLIEVTPNHHVVVRVESHQPKELKPLESVREQIVKSVSLDKATELAKEQALEMVAMLESGSVTRYVADQYGLNWKVIAEAKRNEIRMDREINRKAFSLPRPERGNKSVGYAILSDGDAAVISVTNVKNSSDDGGSAKDLSSFARLLGSQQGYNDYIEFRDNLAGDGVIETR